MKDENKRLKLKKYFTLFELIWFVSLTLATIIVAIIYPEESANGVSTAALNTSELVKEIDMISVEMENNSEVAGKLKDESAVFVKL